MAPGFSLEQPHTTETLPGQSPVFDAVAYARALTTPVPQTADVVKSDGSLNFSNPFAGQPGLTSDQLPPLSLSNDVPASTDGGAQPNGCLEFNSPFPEQAGMTPEQFQPDLDKAKSVAFTTEAQNKKSGTVPDFILGADGKLTRNPAKKQPNKDGSLTIEVQSSNKSELDAKKAANALQKQWAKSMIEMWQRSPYHKGEKIPNDWQALVDAPDPVGTPLPDRSEPSETGRTHYTGGAADTSANATSPDAMRGSGESGGGGGGYINGGGGNGGAGDVQSTPQGDVRIGSGQSWDGANINVSPQSKLANAAIVAEVAKEKGVDPATAIAAMLVESGGNNKAVGDGGTSFGLFQLHQGGELPAGWTPEQAFDPRANAEVALSVFAQTKGHSDPGELAAAAQRPGDPAGYAVKVDENLDEAQKILAEIESKGGTQAVIEAHEKAGEGGGIPAVGNLVMQNEGQQLWAQTDMAGVCENGNLGCAASVSAVMNQAGIDYIHSAAVVGVVEQATNKGWTQSDDLSTAKPGDIIYGNNGGNDQHIGIVGTDGQLWSNQSSSGTWEHDNGYIASHFGANAHVLKAPAEASPQPEAAPPPKK